VRKKKPLLVGIAIGVLARPVIVRAYRPFRHKVQTKLYNLALDFIQNFDANHS
jgi:hypothetical protein